MAPDNNWPSTATTTNHDLTFDDFVRGVTPALKQLSTALNQWQTTFRSTARAVARVVGAFRFTNLVERDRYHLARAHALSFAAPSPPVFDLDLPLRIPTVRSYALRVNSAGRPGRRARRVGGVRA